MNSYVFQEVLGLGAACSNGQGASRACLCRCGASALELCASAAVVGARKSLKAIQITT